VTECDPVARGPKRRAGQRLNGEVREFGGVADDSGENELEGRDRTSGADLEGKVRLPASSQNSRFPLGSMSLDFVR